MKIKNCRCCGEMQLKEIMSYGMVALADNFLDEQGIINEHKYPLRLCLCINCYHVQIDEIIDPKKLFENYVWETGISKSMVGFAEKLFEKTSLYSRGKNLNVLEIASNDGTVLSVYKRNNCKVLGVDPATNIARIARNNGVPTINDFFDLEVAKNIKNNNGKWDICIARNVIAHVKNLHGFVQGINLLLASNGFAVIEFPHLEKMYQDLQYDQVFHEHIGYHSLHSVIRLFKSYGMSVFDVEELTVHGGSLRVFIQHDYAQREISKNVVTVLNHEIDAGIFDEHTWQVYARRCQAHKEDLRTKIETLKCDGYNICIYGASGKGQSLIQMCGINHELVNGVVDKSILKQGKYTPGSHIKIHSPEFIYESKTDVILLCAWNISEEIIKQEKKFIENGGRFLHPFPSPHFIN